MPGSVGNSMCGRYSQLTWPLLTYWLVSGPAPCGEFGAMRAGDRGIFDEPHRRVRIAHAIAGLGRGDDLRPVAIVGRRDLRERRARGEAAAVRCCVVAAAAARRPGPERAPPRLPSALLSSLPLSTNSADDRDRRRRGRSITGGKAARKQFQTCSELGIDDFAQRIPQVRPGSAAARAAPGALSPSRA